MPEIIFVSSFLPPCNLAKIRSYSKGAISNANSNFQLSILDGFLLNDRSPHVINVPNIGAYPFKYRKVLYQGHRYSYHGVWVRDCTFFNLVYIKHLFRRWKVRRELKKLLQIQKVPPIIFVYDLDWSFIKAICDLRTDGYDFIAINIVPDLPGMTGNVNHWAYRTFGKTLHRQMDWTQMDGYVLLSKYMASSLGVGNKPHIIMEGVYSLEQNNVETREDFIELQTCKYILYTGALDKRNGVMHLLDAFKQVDSNDIKLVLCGEGDARDTVIKHALTDTRIVYLGQVDHKVAVGLQRNATLLINPRLPSENFAKYSFPSKTMEYMASGTPLLMYKLASLPIEYEEHVFSPKDETSQGLAQMIREILSMDSQVLKYKGSKARQFIMESKTSRSQIERLLDFSSDICYKKYEYSH